MLLVSYFHGTLKADGRAIATSIDLRLLIAVEVVAFVLAELFIGLSVANKGATIAGLIEISYPLFIALFAYVLFHERVSIGTIIGGILIFCGVMIVHSLN